jgi:hypothetical protein
LVGGIDQLVLKAQGFMANYYTEQEQAGVLASSLTQSLEEAGFSQAQIAALMTREDFRALLESIDISTEQGAEQFAALLTVQQQFADVQTYLESQGVTLLELAEAAPQVALLTLIKDQDATNAKTSLEIANITSDSLISMIEQDKTNASSALEVATESADSLLKIDTGVKTMIDSINALDTTMESGLENISLATSSAMTLATDAIASANASAMAAIAAANQIAAQSSSIAVTQKLATGGQYNGGMALVGERGPELIDLNTSGRVYSASQTASMIGGDVAGEIRALRDEVTLLRYEARSTAVSSAKIARLQDNWDVRGLTVRTDVDQPLDTVAV